jgi:hypothetical protein
MKRSFAHLCLAIIGSLALCLPAQAAFQPGYVVTIKGDTLHGEVDMDSPQAMKHLCRFKSTETGKVTRYKPEELKSFATIDLSRRFISGTVPYFFKDKRLFLEVLQQGRLNLYYTFDVLLNDLFYVSKKEADLVDLMYDWDKNKLVPFKSDYVSFLKKTMVDAPELILDIERMNNPTPYLLSELVGRYNRKFDKSAKTTAALLTSPVAEANTQVGISLSPGLMIPHILFVDEKLTDVFCGLSVTKGPRNKRNGFYTSLGAYIPTFSITTQLGGLDSSIPLDYRAFDYMVLIPANLSYRFSKNKLQPVVGIDVHTFLNNDNSWFVLGPSFGLSYTPIKWLSVSCSFQYTMAQIFTKTIYYQTTTDFTLTTGISINL